jgi:hypothetical protein
MQLVYIERRIKSLRAKPGAMTAERRQTVGQLENDRQEFYEWRMEINDRALLKRAAKIGVYPDEITFPQIDEGRNVGRYHYSASFGNELLRDEFRQPFTKAIREREPIYRKERREQIELIVKIITALTAAATGILGALIGLYAIRK